MKTGKNFFQGFFVKEPKFSVLIALLAIIMLIVLFFSFDSGSVVHFSGFEMKVEYPSLNIPMKEVFSWH